MSVRPKKDTPYATPVSVPEVTAAKTLKSQTFLNACTEVGVKPTKRQAAKYNGKRNRWAER